MLQRDQQLLSLLAMKQLKNIGVFLTEYFNLTRHLKKIGYVGYVYPTAS
jgi:hypothetical protein